MLVSEVDVSEARPDGVHRKDPLSDDLFVVVIDTHSQHGQLREKDLYAHVLEVNSR